MQTLITTSGFTIVPPSGLNIVFRTIGIANAATSNVTVSGSLSTFIQTVAITGPSDIDVDLRFSQNENVTVSPSSGTLTVLYVTAGEPDAMKYAYGVSWYSDTAPLEAYHQRWVGSTSGTYQPISGGFGG